ncbi:hypothetical protein SLT36_23675 [Aminobacter sp. BA135]|uniref:hypothetical protein n=1 Tax=Aminobacter sp. BA135 TaxID=537596 RepID=UPI003D7B6272
MPQRVIVDSNMLQERALRAYFLEAPDNFVVLPDFLWAEIYKQQSIAGLAAAFSVIRDFPDRLVGLRSAGELAILDPRGADLVERMLYQNVPEKMRSTFEAVALAEQGTPWVLEQLVERWSAASAHMDGMLEGAVDIVQSLPEVADIFTAEEKRLCRTSYKYTPAMMEKIFGAAEQLYEEFIKGYEVSAGHVSPRHYYDAYLYRHGLAIIIYSLWWIRNGSQLPKRLDKARNDFIDLSFAIYATYFDGFLTQDTKAHWMYSNLHGALKALGARHLGE